MVINLSKTKEIICYNLRAIPIPTPPFIVHIEQITSVKLLLKKILVVNSLSILNTASLFQVRDKTNQNQGQMSPTFKHF